MSFTEEVDYTDTRLPLDVSTFARPEFDKESLAGSFDINMGRVPVLYYNDAIIGQSKSIERFLAKKFGLNGSNEIEEAHIDMIGEHVSDIKQKYGDVRVGKSGEELAQAKAKFLTEDLPKWYQKLEKTLVLSQGFAVGSKISLADVLIHGLVKDYFDDKEKSEAAIQGLPKLIASANAVETVAKTWLETRPVTSM